MCAPVHHTAIRDLNSSPPGTTEPMSALSSPAAAHHRALGTRSIPRSRQHLLVSAAQAAGRRPLRQEVSVKLTATSFSSRKLQASVDINAPLPVVWEALTDYDNLGSFIPSLVENRCIERRKQGCLLYQVGAQDVALGIKFSAACTLEITEYPQGIPPSMTAAHGSDYARYFPSPPSSSSSSSGATSTSSVSSYSSYSSYSSMDSMSSMDEASSSSSSSSGTRDISFNLVQGDFQAFKGIWRMSPAGAGPSCTTLQYSLFVRPHPWLPVKLIEDRISSEVVNNLTAVRQHTEKVHKRRQQQQQQQQEVQDVNGASSAGGLGQQHSTLSSSSSSSSSNTTAGLDSVSSQE